MVASGGLTRLGVSGQDLRPRESVRNSVARKEMNKEAEGGLRIWEPLPSNDWWRQENEKN